MKNFSYLRIYPLSIFVMSILLALKISMIAEFFFSKNLNKVEFNNSLVAEARAGVNVPTNGVTQKPDSTKNPVAAGCVGADSSCGSSSSGVVDSQRVELLQQLAERQKALDTLAAQITEREKLVAASEEVLRDKMNILNKTQAEYEAAGEQHQKISDADFERLVKIYENMNPRDAAQIFNVLDMKIMVGVIDRMNPRKASAIMAGMVPQRVNLATQNLANLHKVEAVVNVSKSH